MKCWYLIDTTCDRPPGICEGCEKYEDWRKESERMVDDRRIKELIERHKETLNRLAEDD